MRERIATIASYIDLTSLNNSDTVATIETLSDNASFDGIEVAALCVFPELIVAAKQALQQRGLSLPVATGQLRLLENHERRQRHKINQRS